MFDFIERFSVVTSPLASALRLTLAMLLASVMVGCAGDARLSEFESFARAGNAYAESIAPLVDESFNVTVAFDSEQLIRNRKALGSQDERLTELELNNADLYGRILILNDFKRHAMVLKSYFISMQSLATSNAAEEAGQSAVGFVDALGQLSERIKSAQIGTLSVGDLAGRLVPIVVAKVQSAALNKFLEESAQTVRVELELQRAAVQALGESMDADLKDAALLEDFERIVKPYVDESSTLPSDWADRRAASFARDLRISQLSSAQTAASNLRQAFDELLQGRLTQVRIEALVSDVEQILTIVGDLKEKQGG